MPVVVMNTWSPLPRSTTFVSPVDQCDAGGVARLAHRGDDPLQIAECKPFLENERCREESRNGAADGQVIDGPMNRQLADVAAGKKQGPNDEGIRGEGDPRWRLRTGVLKRDGRLIFQRGENLIVEARQKDPLNQFRASVARRFHGRAECARTATAARDNSRKESSDSRAGNGFISDHVLLAANDMDQIPEHVE